MKQTVSVGWLDFSDEHQKRAREYLRRTEQEGTVDELGFGIMRDAFAGLFFPATNTVMTRTRYLVFVPLLYLMIEEEQVPSSRVERRLAELENQLRTALESTERAGVIGRVSKEELQRPPSGIYWNAIKELGIFQQTKWTQSYYHAHLDEYYSANKTTKDDDGLPHPITEEAQNWDAAFRAMILEDGWKLGAETRFPNKLSFNLSRREARYLKARFDTCATPKGQSLLSFLLNERFSASFNYPWDAPCPDSLKKTVHHAKCFSMLAKGATLQYHHLLLKARRAAGLEVPDYKLSAVFAQWWKTCRRELSCWNLDEFFEIVRGLGSARTGDREFVKAWTTACLCHGTRTLNDHEAEDLIRDREMRKRPHKARLHDTEYLKQWEPLPSVDDPFYSNPIRMVFLLDFRANIGCVFVRDILEGMKRRD